MDMLEMLFYIWCGFTIADILVVSNCCSYIEKVDIEKLLNKNKVKKQVENEYKNNEYIKINENEIKRIAVNMIKEDNIFMHIYKIYLIIMFIFPLFIFQELWESKNLNFLYVVLNLINLIYTFVVFGYHFYKKRKKEMI